MDYKFTACSIAPRKVIKSSLISAAVSQDLHLCVLRCHTRLPTVPGSCSARIHVSCSCSVWACVRSRSTGFCLFTEERCAFWCLWKSDSCGKDGEHSCTQTRQQIRCTVLCPMHKLGSIPLPLCVRRRWRDVSGAAVDARRTWLDTDHKPGDIWTCLHLLFWYIKYSAGIVFRVVGTQT